MLSHDFLSQTFDPDGQTFVEAYLKRRGWKETPRTKAYMKALSKSVMSLYEVSEIAPGQSFLARDLLRPGKPIIVSDANRDEDIAAMGADCHAYRAVWRQKGDCWRLDDILSRNL